MENLLLAVVLAAMALLPLAEILLRAIFKVGISGAASFTQHLALIAGMLGAAVAARERRLLSLSTLDSLLKGRAAAAARFFTGSVAVIVGALLCLASVEFVLAERSGGNAIAYGIPIWLGQAVLPLGFALITLRLAWSAADNWPARLATLLLAGAAAAAAANRLPLNDATAITAISLVLIAATL
ncbi:MAG: TRAP transporter small permease [Pseudomonadota bacterium]|nr:TRAP transporter small permease [Pseudomonadota bacterium]